MGYFDAVPSSAPEQFEAERQPDVGSKSISHVGPTHNLCRGVGRTVMKIGAHKWMRLSSMRCIHPLII